MAKTRFSVGQVVATPGALEALEAANTSSADLLHRHQTGDWGELSAEDRQLNEDAIGEGTRILSAYRLCTDARIWVITEADRSSTCLLLPEEY